MWAGVRGLVLELFTVLAQGKHCFRQLGRVQHGSELDQARPVSLHFRHSFAQLELSPLLEPAGNSTLSSLGPTRPPGA